MSEREVKVLTGYSPRAHQLEIHRGLKRFSVLVCHRRFGKTVLAVNALIDAALRTQKERARFAYIAPLYSQAKQIAWDYLRHFTASVPQVKRNESELYVELPNNARIKLFGADNPDSLRGMYFDGVVLDEVAQMRPEVWGEIVRPAISDRLGWALFIGTPKGFNLFSDLYQQAIRSEGWYAGLFKASTTEIIPPEELAAARAMMSDSQYRQEFECDFSASVEDTLIPIQLVDEASQRLLVPDVYKHAPKVLGVDVARFGDDKSVLVCRQGLVAYGIRKYRDLDTMRLADIVIQVQKQEGIDAVFVDVVGLGAGVVDRLRQLGHRVIDVNAGSTAGDEAQFYNKRAEMWVLMRDWLKDGGAIPDDLELKADLVSARYSYDLRNRIVLEKKADMKKRGLASPDCADALALTFAQPVHVMTELERVVAINRASTRTYNPLHHF